MPQGPPSGVPWICISVSASFDPFGQCMFMFFLGALLFILLVMASNLIAMASHLVAMA